MDIIEFLTSHGLKIEKPEEFKTEFFKNFKTVGELGIKSKKLEKLNQELEEVSSQLKTKSEENEKLSKKLSEMEKTNKATVDELNKSLSTYKMKDSLLAKGVRPEYSDFVLYKLGDTKEEEVDAKLKEIIGSNPFIQEPKVKVNVIPEGKKPKLSDSFNDKIREAFLK